MKHFAIRPVVTVLTTVPALTLNVAMKPGSLLGGSSARADGYQPTNPCEAPNQISSSRSDRLAAVGRRHLPAQPEPISLRSVGELDRTEPRCTRTLLPRA